jgi:hypothetical protein
MELNNFYCIFILLWTIIRVKCFKKNVFLVFDEFRSMSSIGDIGSEWLPKNIFVVPSNGM